MEAWDSSPASRAVDAGDAPQAIERRLNGAAGEPRSVAVGEKKGIPILPTTVMSALSHIGHQRLGELRTNRHQPVLEELRAAHR